MGTTNNGSARYCIVGGGPSGLAAAKTFLERGIPFDCFEREADVGGIWNPQSPHAVYQSTFLNSSKRMSRFMRFRMPEAYPHYVSAAQAHEYLRAYARAFGLYERIAFNSPVDWVERADSGWRVRLAQEPRPRSYSGVVIANGHHWQPRLPDLPGRFAGELLHSHDVKTRVQLKDKRVLVVGAGNSGVDIVSDAAREAAAAIHSMRRTYHLAPKMVFGRPADVVVDKMSRWPLPRSVLRTLYATGLKLLVGPYERYGLTPPDHRLFERHPTLATTYLDHLAHGRIAVKPAIERIDGKSVRFTDGSVAEVDLIVCATGFRLSFPLIDERLVLDGEGRPDLFLNVFHRGLDELVVVGLVEAAEGGLWPLAEWQARLAATFIVAQARGAPEAQWFRGLKARARPDLGHGLRPSVGDWACLAVQHYRYRKYVRRLLTKFGAMAEASYPVPGPAEAPRLAGAA